MNITNNYSPSNLEKVLLINQQEIKLTITNTPGTCSKCQIVKEIRLIAQQNGRSSKEYCWSCSLDVLKVIINLPIKNRQLRNYEQN